MIKFYNKMEYCEKNFYKENIKFLDNLFLQKFKEKLEKVEIYNGFIKGVKLKKECADIYEKGYLSLLNECEKVDISGCDIKVLSYKKLPKKVNCIIAEKCENLQRIDLSELDNIIGISILLTKSKIKSLKKLPKAITSLILYGCDNIDKINLDYVEVCGGLDIRNTKIRKLIVEQLPKEIGIIKLDKIVDISDITLEKLKEKKKNLEQIVIYENKKVVDIKVFRVTYIF